MPTLCTTPHHGTNYKPLGRTPHIQLTWTRTQVLGNVSFFLVLIIFFCIGIFMFLLPPVPGIPVYLSSGKHHIAPHYTSQHHTVLRYS